MSYEIGTIWLSSLKEKDKYGCWLRMDSKWKFIGWRKMSHSPWPDRFISKPHARDIKLKPMKDES